MYNENEWHSFVKGNMDIVKPSDIVSRIVWYKGDRQIPYKRVPTKILNASTIFFAREFTRIVHTLETYELSGVELESSVPQLVITSKNTHHSVTMHMGELQNAVCFMERMLQIAEVAIGKLKFVHSGYEGYVEKDFVPIQEMLIPSVTHRLHRLHRLHQSMSKAANMDSIHEMANKQLADKHEATIKDGFARYLTHTKLPPMEAAARIHEICREVCVEKCLET